MGFLILIVLLGGVCGLLAALAGEGEPKFLRRVIVPLITTIFSLIALRSFWALFLFFRAVVLSQGYGIPDVTDPGSKIGAFWFRILKDNENAASIATRATLGFQEVLVLATVPLIKGCWFFYIIASLMIIGVYVWFGALHLTSGRFNFFGKDLDWGEVEIHGINSFIIMLFVLLCR